MIICVVVCWYPYNCTYDCIVMASKNVIADITEEEKLDIVGLTLTNSHALSKVLLVTFLVSHDLM